MAVDIKVNADTSGAIAALEQLGNKVEGLQKKFGDNLAKMTAAAAALSATLIAAGHEAMAFADEITDLAAANQLAVGEILAFNEALAQNGGKAESAGRMLQTLANNVDAVNGGNVKSLKSFTDLGVSMQDLGNLSQTEIRDKVLDSLAAIADPMERNAKAMAMFGKAAIGVDFKKFAEDQKQGRLEQERFAPALKTAGDAADRLGLIMERTKVAFAQAFEPVFKIISELNPTVDDLTTKFKVMGAVLAVLTAGATVGAVLKLVEAFKLLGLVVSRNPLVALATAALGVATYFGLGASKADELSKSTDGVADSTNKVKRNQDDLNKALADESDKINKIGRELQNNFDIVLRKYQQEFKNLSLSEEQKTIAEAIAKIEEDAIAAKKKAQDEYNAMSLDAQARQKQALADELKGIDDKAAKQKRAIEDQLKGFQDLQARIKDFNSAFSTQSEFRKLGFEAEAKAMIDSASSMNERIDLETRLMTIQKYRSELMSKIPSLAEDERGKANQAISAATDDINLLGKSYYAIGEIIKDSLVGNLVDAKISQEGFDKIIGKQQASYNSITQSAAHYNRILKDVSAQSREFSTGWNKAFIDFANNAMNAAQQAQNIFNKLTQGLEDMFINFFKTGKLDWRNFMASIVEEIARAQIKQAIVKLLGGLGMGKLGKESGMGGALAAAAGASAGQSQSQGETPQSQATREAFYDIKTVITEFTTGIGNFLSSMFSGLGNMISSFVSGLSGIISSLGSSLFDMISSLGSTLWDVVSGLGSSLGDILGGLGGGGGGSFLSDAIGFVGSLFGFANGGVIPNNGPVLVGEKGPELLFGSQGAAVMPMGNMGSTNITYNINAVDALSFKQMVAADPTFIYAVTMQGAKGMPVRR